MPEITATEKQKRRRRVSVFLDGEYAFSLGLEVLQTAGLAVGAELTPARQVEVAKLFGEPVEYPFVGGLPDKVERVRRQLPGSSFTAWRTIRSAVRDVLRATRAEVRRRGVAPLLEIERDTRSPKPLAGRLGLKAGMTLCLVDPPKDVVRILGPLPPGVTLRRGARGKAPMALCFLREARRLEARFTAATRVLAPPAKLWLAWPKKASGEHLDLGQREVRAFALARGWVDYKVASISPIWSGMLFAKRRP